MDLIYGLTLRDRTTQAAVPVPATTVSATASTATTSAATTSAVPTSAVPTSAATASTATTSAATMLWPLSKIYKKDFDDGRNEQIVEEFEQIEADTAEFASEVVQYWRGQPPRNWRYSNLRPVVFQTRYTHDKIPFVDANKIYLPDGVQTVIGAAPKPESFFDWWFMVSDLSVKVIVMLTDYIEKGKSKADPYIPQPGETVTYRNGDDTISVTCVLCPQEPDYRNITQHVLTVKLNGKEQIVQHLHYIGWPDHGVIKGDVPLTEFARLVERYRWATADMEDGEHTLVHCSAGIGRSGTFVAIDHLLRVIWKKREDALRSCECCEDGCKDLGHIMDTLDSIEISVESIVREMRTMRTGLVQTAEQYAFIFEFICWLIRNGYLD